MLLVLMVHESSSFSSSHIAAMPRSPVRQRDQPVRFAVDCSPTLDTTEQRFPTTPKRCAPDQLPAWARLVLSVRFLSTATCMWLVLKAPQVTMPALQRDAQDAAHTQVCHPICRSTLHAISIAETAVGAARAQRRHLEAAASPSRMSPASPVTDGEEDTAARQVGSIDVCLEGKEEQLK